MPWVNLNRDYSIFAGLVLAGMLPAASLPAVESKTISAVDVQQEEGGVTRIVLSGAEDPIYTAFIREDPRRLIVEMPDVVFNGVPTPVRVGNGVVSSVMLGAFGDPRVALSMARVSIGLEGEVDYELLPDSDKLVIEIRPKFDLVAKAASPNEPSTAPADEMAADESVPAAMLPDSFESVLGAAAMGADERAEPASEPGHAANPTTTPTLATEADHPEVSRIEKVVANGDTIEILADGPIDNIDSFALGAPERLVIDFWGAQNGISPRQFAVAGNRVERVRIGEYPDKVRVVFDLGVTLESHLVEPTHNGVLVRLVASATSAMAAAGPVPAAADTSDESAVEPDPETAGPGPSASPRVDPTLW